MVLNEVNGVEMLWRGVLLVRKGSLHLLLPTEWKLDVQPELQGCYQHLHLGSCGIQTILCFNPQ